MDAVQLKFQCPDCKDENGERVEVLAKAYVTADYKIFFRGVCGECDESMYCFYALEYITQVASSMPRNGPEKSSERVPLKPPLQIAPPEFTEEDVLYLKEMEDAFHEEAG